MLTTYHTHSLFCDGKMMPEDYVRSAIRKGFTAFGFSGHAPVSFKTDWTMKPEKLQEYMDTAQSLKVKYKDWLQIYTGLETDYYAGGRDYRSLPGLDYTIGSVHFLYDKVRDRYMEMDGTAAEFEETRDTLFKGSIRDLIEAYYRLLMEMILKQTPNIVGHLDILKKNNAGNRFFDETKRWYRDIVSEALEVIKSHAVIVEVNTGGISRGYTKEIYPSSWILSLMREIGIPVVLTSDAHHPDWIDAYYPEALEIMKAAGFTSQRVLLDGIWQDVEL